MTTLIGIMGQKRSGKDTVASALVQNHGFVRVAFADRLKEAAYYLNPIVGHMALPDSLQGEKRLRDVVDALGWERAKTCPEIRRTLQEYGMSIRLVQPSFWIDAAMTDVKEARRRGLNVCITDVRFLNEVDAIRAEGGKILRVDRPGLPDDDTHVSEHAWREVQPDVTLLNDSSIDDLFAQVARVV